MDTPTSIRILDLIVELQEYADKLGNLTEVIAVDTDTCQQFDIVDLRASSGQCVITVQLH